MSDDRWTEHDIDGKSTLRPIGLEGRLARAQLRELLIAPERSEGGPCCADCAPIQGEHAPYQQNFNDAPLLRSDPLNPVVGICPACGKAWMVPDHVAIARLSALVSLLLRDRVERLSPDEWEQRLREVVDGT